MTYSQVMEYVESLRVYGSVPGLLNMRNLCRKLKEPQKELSFVHIAGTNGKGSVLAFVSSVLKEAGYRVGRYLSPVLSDYRERIQLGGRKISKEDLCLGMSLMRRYCEELVSEGQPHPTAFEIETALAFWYFREKKCDIVVLETGMGGELDATNVVENTLAAVFTPISFDHRKVLGHTLGEIARTKSGIMKPGCVAVTANQKEEVMKELRDRAEGLKVPLSTVRQEKLKGVKSSLERQKFSYDTFRDLEIRLIGRYQIDNAVLAMETLRALSEKGYPVSEKALRLGLSGAVWPGRFQLLCKKPVFIADGAHNPEGAVRLAQSLCFYFTNKRIIYIMGILRDKEREEIIKATCPYASRILTVPTRGERGLSSYELACEVKAFHPDVTALDSVQEAVELSFLLAGREDVIVAFGSLSYLGELIKTVQERDKIRSDSHGKQRKD